MNASSAIPCPPLWLPQACIINSRFEDNRPSISLADWPAFNTVTDIAASPTPRPKLPAYHDIQHRMVEWQQQHDPS